MITRITLMNFKAHLTVDMIDIPRVAVIVGQNNSGKSAILQAAASPRYTLQDSTYLPTGTSQDLLRRGSTNGAIEVYFDGAPGPYALMFKSNGIEKETSVNAKFKNSIFYISGFRSPTRTFGYDQFIPEVGMAGERTWDILHQLKANDDSRLRRIKSWMKMMGMGLSAMATPTAHPGAGRLEITSYGTRTNLVLQGSGVSSVLPIVVQGVLCPPGSTLLLEEPDAHLHRAALDGLLRFFGYCADRGVQVICTTHSIDLLASMSERIDSDEMPKDSAIFMVKRGARGETSVSRLDPKVFYNIRMTIKKELAAKKI